MLCYGSGLRTDEVVPLEPRHVDSQGMVIRVERGKGKKGPPGDARLRPGVLAVLHTWNQRLRVHPHIHCLVTGRGLGPDGFVHRRRFLVRLKVLRPVLKAKLLSKLQALLRDGSVSVARDSAHDLLRDASRREWNIDIRRPLGGPEQVVNYFARYTRKIAISDQRLVSYDG
jgi:integrase